MPPAPGTDVPPSVRHIILSTVFFALMQVCVKEISHLPTAVVVFFRGAVALVLCVVMLGVKRASPFGRRKGLLILRGISGTLALYLFFYTLQRIPLAAAVTIQYLAPPFTVLIASVVFREGATVWQWLALLLALAGVALIQGFDPEVPLLLALCGVASSVFSAISYNVIRAIGPEEDPLVIVFYFPMVASLLLAPMVVSEWQTPTPRDWVFILLTGIFVQIAQILMTKAYQHDKAANIVAYKYLGAVWAILFGWLVYGEPLRPVPALGMALVILAALGASLLAPRKTRSAPAE